MKQYPHSNAMLTKTSVIMTFHSVYEQLAKKLILFIKYLT